MDETVRGAMERMISAFGNVIDFDPAAVSMDEQVEFFYEQVAAAPESGEKYDFGKLSLWNNFIAHRNSYGLRVYHPASGFDAIPEQNAFPDPFEAVASSIDIPWDAFRDAPRELGGTLLNNTPPQSGDIVGEWLRENVNEWLGDCVVVLYHGYKQPDGSQTFSAIRDINPNGPEFSIPLRRSYLAIPWRYKVWIADVLGSGAGGPWRVHHESAWNTDEDDSFPPISDPTKVLTFAAQFDFTNA